MMPIYWGLSVGLMASPKMNGSVGPARCQKLRRHEPRQLKNPFKPGTFVAVRSSIFFAIDNEEIIGILTWEESECISVFGSDPRMDAFVIQVCAVFNAEFERLNPNV